MERIIQEVRPWAELAYFISTTGLLIIGLYGLRQVSLLKDDMRHRYDRAAKEKAIDAAQRYLTAFVKLADRKHDEFRARSLKSYSGPIGDFSLDSIPRQLRDNAAKRFESACWLAALNELQGIAASFVTGVADEQVGFEIIGRSFCHSVRVDYDILCCCRSESVSPYFESIVRLYGVWAPRLQKSELAAARDSISSKIDQISDRSIPHLGQDH